MNAERRPEVPDDAGMDSRKLDLELTRNELAETLDLLFAKFNLRLMVQDRPVLFGALGLAGIASVVLGVLAILRKRGRG